MAFLIAPDRLRDLRIAELRWRLRRNERLALSLINTDLRPHIVMLQLLQL